MPNLYLKPEDFSPQDVRLQTASIKEAKAAIERGDKVLIGYDREAPDHVLTTLTALEHFLKSRQ